MLTSNPALSVNQKSAALGIPNRFNLNANESSEVRAGASPRPRPAAHRVQLPGCLGARANATSAAGGAGWHRQPMLVGVGRIEHAMQMDDDIFHRRIVDGALGIGTPGGLGGGIIGEDADHVELVGFDEIKGLRIADAAAEDEMKLAHGRRFSRMALRTPVVKIRRLARKAVSAAIEPTVAIRGLACERPLRRTPDVLINLLELNSGNDA